jgi:hypothetical protein
MQSRLYEKSRRNFDFCRSERINVIPDLTRVDGISDEREHPTELVNSIQQSYKKGS